VRSVSSVGESESTGRKRVVTRHPSGPRTMPGRRPRKHSHFGCSPLPLARLYLLTPPPSAPPITAEIIGGERVDFCWLVIDRRSLGLAAS
jgi:hypothetical protein